MACRFTSEMKIIILDMFAKGLSTVQIARVLKTMCGYTITGQGLFKFWKRQENLVTASSINNGGDTLSISIQKIFAHPQTSVRSLAF